MRFNRLVHADEVRLEMSNDSQTAYGDLIIEVPEECFVDEREDAEVFWGETWHTNVVTNAYCTAHLTATSGSNSNVWNEVRRGYELPDGQSAYVCVLMSSTEVYPSNETLRRDDRIRWRVVGDGVDVMAGETRVMANLSAFAIAQEEYRHYYGMPNDPILVACRRFDSTDDDPLYLMLSAKAWNEDDGLRKTCVQIVVFPIDENDRVVGLPDWIPQP